MLEIIGKLLATMLLFKGLGFIVQAFNRQTDNAGGLIVSLAAAAFSIMAAVYFYNQIDDQASGARRAINEISSQYEEIPEAKAPEAVSPY